MRDLLATCWHHTREAASGLGLVLFLTCAVLGAVTLWQSSCAGSSPAAYLKEKRLTERHEQLVKQLQEAGVHIHRYESNFAPDEDGGFELALVSELPTYENVPDEDEAAECRAHTAALEAAGLEVLSMNAACWEGYSEYTPDPGDVRRCRVRFK